MKKSGQNSFSFGRYLGKTENMLRPPCIPKSVQFCIFWPSCVSLGHPVYLQSILQVKGALRNSCRMILRYTKCPKDTQDTQEIQNRMPQRYKGRSHVFSVSLISFEGKPLLTWLKSRIKKLYYRKYEQTLSEQSKKV